MVGNKHPGSFGNAACLSFHPRKSITTGEGGMILTDDFRLADCVRSLRNHGASIYAEKRNNSAGVLLPEYREAGYNYRMTDIQGAIGVAQTDKLDGIIQEKRRLANEYSRRISECVPELITPYQPDGYYHTYQSYVCCLDYDSIGAKSIEHANSVRNRIMERLADKGIITRQGTHAVHILGYYADRFKFKRMDFPESYKCDRLSISLPLFYGMEIDDIDLVVGCLRNLFDSEEVVK